MEAVVCAWRCYQQGAAGALFDVLAFCDACRIAPWDFVAAERDFLLADALRGEGVTRGKGARAPLAAHDAALRKRRRWHAVCRILFNAWRYEHERQNAKIHRFGPEWWDEHRTWPEVSDKELKACELAKEELGETTLDSARPIYNDYREVAKEIGHLSDRTAFPGRYYLPTEETCDRFGLEWGMRLHREQRAATDGPVWLVA